MLGIWYPQTVQRGVLKHIVCVALLLKGIVTNKERATDTQVSYIHFWCCCIFVCSTTWCTWHQHHRRRHHHHPDHHISQNMRVHRKSARLRSSSLVSPGVSIHFQDIHFSAKKSDFLEYLLYFKSIPGDSSILMSRVFWTKSISPAKRSTFAFHTYLESLGFTSQFGRFGTNLRHQNFAGKLHPHFYNI